MEQGRFWFVWNVEGRNPRYMHASRLSADREAERLARENPGQQFVVLKAVGGFESEPPQSPPVTKIDMKKFVFDNIPF